MEITLQPTLKQHLAYEALSDETTKFVVFGGSAGGGKSWLLCEWILVRAIQFPNTRWFIGRNELTRLMSSTYITFTKVAKHHGYSDWKLNGQYHFIELGNGSRIDLLDVKYQPSDPLYERFGSTEYTGGALEEAGEIDFGAFDVLKSRVGRHLNKEYTIKPKILITCNPKKNWLYRDVYKPYTEGKLHSDYMFIQALYSDNPHTAESYKEQLSSISDKTMKERLMFGNWEYENDPRALMNYDAIIDLFTNTVEPTKHEKYLTVDVARYGNDRTVLAMWEDFSCVWIKTYEKNGVDVVAEKIRTELRDNHIPFSKCIIDEDGVGGGVVDILRGVRGFMANRSPFPNKYTGRPDNYANLKAQATYLMAELVNNHKMSVYTQDEGIKASLIEELEVIRAKNEVIEGKLAIESKDVIKELLGRSPDIADALMLRMYFELESPTNAKNMVDPIASLLARGALTQPSKTSNSFL